MEWSFFVTPMALKQIPPSMDPDEAGMLGVSMHRSRVDLLRSP